jgi:sugar-phosphatase
VTPAALLLDLDGTLVDSEPVHRAAYRAFFEARGWEPPDLTLFTGRRAEDVFATEPGPWAGHDFDALAEEVTALVDVSGAPDPVAGATALIEAAHRLGVPVAVVTSAGPAWTHAAIDGPLDSRERIDLVVTADDVVDGKPDPTGYRLACERLGVDPATALAVEDSPAGVRAAVAAGVGEVVGISTTHDAAELTEAGAGRVVPDLVDLARSLGG